MLLSTLVHPGTLNIPEATYIVYGPLRTINYVFIHALTIPLRPSESASVSYFPLDHLLISSVYTIHIPLGRTQTHSSIYIAIGLLATACYFATFPAIFYLQAVRHTHSALAIVIGCYLAMLFIECYFILPSNASFPTTNAILRPARYALATSRQARPEDAVSGSSTRRTTTSHYCMHDHA